MFKTIPRISYWCSFPRNVQDTPIKKKNPPRPLKASTTSLCKIGGNEEEMGPLRKYYMVSFQNGRDKESGVHQKQICTLREMDGFGRRGML